MGAGVVDEGGLSDGPYDRGMAQARRTDQEVLARIVAVAAGDERIRAVVLAGSRANPDVAPDRYQDFDVAYLVTDVQPFRDNPEWVRQRFGEPSILQMPEAMRWPDGGDLFTYLMIFPDGHRIDLSFQASLATFLRDGEPGIVLFDKDDGRGLVPPLPEPTDAVWHITPPSPLFYSSCCNNFWWCLGNVGKGIVRDELPYALQMLNTVVRPELHDMMSWYVGATHGFGVSVGKWGKWFKRYLPPQMYERYTATFSTADPGALWTSVLAMADLFHDLALVVAADRGLPYRQDEEDGMRQYLRWLRTGPVSPDRA